MSTAASVPRKPDYRAPVDIPTNWCVSCEMPLRTEAEYFAHIGLFPTHYVKQITKLMCPSCGKVTALEGGRFATHWVGYSHDKECSGSGKSV